MEELLKKRRSIRKYKSEKINKNEIDAIIKCGLLSPSAKNSKPWEIYVTEDKEKIGKLSKAKPTGVSFIKDAPLVFVLVADKTKSSVWIEDVAIMATIMHIKAHELGIGSCWIQIRGREHDENMSANDYVKLLLDIGENKEVLCLLSFGYPDEIKKETKENDILYNRVIWK